MKIGIGSDHGGYDLKKYIISHLAEGSIEFVDYGTYSKDSVDYPDFARKVAEGVIEKEVDYGILICGTGIGISIAANKIRGIRCALCGDVYSAKMSKEHNNANILALGGRVIGPDLALEIVDAWMKAKFQGGRHEKRINKISEMES